MLLWILRPLRLLVQAVASDDSPRRLALGFAIGMLIGLVPKGNLTAGLLMVLLLATRVNFASGAVAMLVFSWFGMLIDPFSGFVGWSLLSNPKLAGLFAFLFDLPIFPWTALNNTVVLGSFMIGIWLFLPLYHISQRLFATYHPRLVARLRKFKLIHLLEGSELAASWRVG